MRSDEELRRALGRPDLPWPDEAGAYERFLRRRARHGRTTRAVTVLTLALAVAAAVVAVGLLPAGRPRPVAAPPVSHHPVSQTFKPPRWARALGPARAVASGQRDGVRWEFAAVRVLVPNERLRRVDQMLCLAFIRGRPRTAPQGPCGNETAPFQLLHAQLTPTVDGEVGMVTSAAAQVRLELWSGATLTVNTVDGRPDFAQDFFVAFHPRSDPVRRIALLDAGGRVISDLGETPPQYQPDLEPTDRRRLVAQAPSGAGPLRLFAYHSGRYVCAEPQTFAGDDMSGIAHCDGPAFDTGRIFLLFYQCGRVDYAFAAVPRAVRRVRFTFPDAATMEVATRDGGSSFGRSFLITPLPKGRGGTAVALDQAGAWLGSYPVERCP
jgi:hypothetical protein